MGDDLTSGLPWPSSSKCDTWAIKTSLVRDQIKVNWTIAEFGEIPKIAEMLKLYSTTFQLGVKKNIPCQWRLGLGLSKCLVADSADGIKVDEEWLSLTYAVETPPPNALKLFCRLGIELEDPDYGSFSWGSVNLQAWNNLEDVFSFKILPRPERWPKDKPLEVCIDFTMVVKKETKTLVGAGDASQGSSQTDNKSKVMSLQLPSQLRNPLLRRKGKK